MAGTRRQTVAVTILLGQPPARNVRRARLGVNVVGGVRSRRDRQRALGSRKRLHDHSGEPRHRRLSSAADGVQYGDGAAREFGGQSGAKCDAISVGRAPAWLATAVVVTAAPAPRPGASTVTTIGEPRAARPRARRARRSLASGSRTCRARARARRVGDRHRHGGGNHRATRRAARRGRRHPPVDTGRHLLCYDGPPPPPPPPPMIMVAVALVLTLIVGALGYPSIGAAGSARSRSKRGKHANSCGRSP